MALKSGASKYVLNALFRAYPECKDIKDKSGITCQALFRKREEEKLNDSVTTEDVKETGKTLTPEKKVINEKLAEEVLVNEDICSNDAERKQVENEEMKSTQVLGWQTVSSI